MASVLVGFALTGLAAVPGGAQTSNADRQAQLNQQIAEVGSAEAEALRALQQIRDRKAPIDAKVADLNAQLKVIDDRLAVLDAESARLGVLITDEQAKYDTAQREFVAARARFDDEAASMYRSARRGLAYDVVDAAQPVDLLKGAAYLATLNRQQQQIVRKIADLRDAAAAQRKELAQKKASADTATAEVVTLRDQAAAKRAEVEPMRAQAAAEAKNEENQLTVIRSQKGQYQNELAALQAASDNLAGQLRGSGPGSATHCAVRPVNGPVTSTFGSRPDPFTGVVRTHSGIDIGASTGTPIKACRSGRVLTAGWVNGYGNLVVLDHGGGMATAYGHQSQIAVSVGQQVSAGQVIGYVGSTGYSTGPHLHFEVRINGNPVDPMPYY